MTDPGYARQTLEAQRAAFEGQDANAAVRIDRLARAVDLLLAHEREICAALAEDFGRRSETFTRFVDILPAVTALRHAKRCVKHWMRPERRRIGLPAGAPGARAAIVHQPLGVVGIIGPWNFPITLTFGPLAGVLAAGNRCMIKPSELTPATSALLERRVAEYFDPAEVAVVSGGAGIAEEFSRLPFDHLLFTGSTAIGRRVMAAAADNLVPVTLELGGKCPVVIGRSANLRRAVDRIMLGKTMNAGQMCLAPDYVCLPEELVDRFIQEAAAWVGRAYPDIAQNGDYTSLASPRQAARLRELLEDAAGKGARVIPLATPDRMAGVALPETAGAVPGPVLLVGVGEEMRIMREEIFGPLLPLIGYRRMEDALARIHSQPRPLALYYFGADRREEQWVMAHTHSGGVTVNDIAAHFLAEELPFGGVGASGMGAYHGEQGFKTFSHARAVLRQTFLDVHGWAGLRPPYGVRAHRVLKLLLRR